MSPLEQPSYKKVTSCRPGAALFPPFEQLSYRVTSCRPGVPLILTLIALIISCRPEDPPVSLDPPPHPRPHLPVHLGRRQQSLPQSSQPPPSLRGCERLPPPGRPHRSDRQNRRRPSRRLLARNPPPRRHRLAPGHRPRRLRHPPPGPNRRSRPERVNQHRISLPRQAPVKVPSGTFNRAAPGVNSPT